MTQSEFDAFLERTIPEYAEEKSRAGYWTPEEALEKSRLEFAELLPDGLHSKDHYLYTLHDEGVPVGIIWLKANPDRPTKNGFIFELYVEPDQRGKGYGRMLMQLIEEKARELGLKSIGLHVFGFNHVARKLYESLGYETTSVNMSKNL
jgi:ribosomal protein S18 acetylase RimI-like enzyme